jgi:triosephosphate isomerase
MVNFDAVQRQPWVVGNWKMHGSLSENERLLSDLVAAIEAHPSGVPMARCAVAVPSPYLFQAAVRLKGHPVGWGAQDVSAEPMGAFTGEVSVGMLQDFEAQFALVGHSERRARWGESDAVVAAKAKALAQAGLTPVVCVGESLQARDQGQAEAVVCEQVRVVVGELKSNNTLESVVFAYEPIWAIGTGRSATPDQAQQMHAAIRRTIAEADGAAAQRTVVLYGGSVKASSATELFAQPDIDGALVGGASLNAQEFYQIACSIRGH